LISNLKISFDLDENTFKKLKEEGEKDFRNVSQTLRWILLTRYADN